MAAKLLKMKERNNCIEEMKKEMKEKLKQERSSNRKRYLDTLKNLILQGMIKLLEPSLQICCREDDVKDIKGMTSGIEKEFSKFMKDKTGRDEYECKLSVMGDRFIKPEQDEDCGGIILYTDDHRIVCPNMLISRLGLAFEECLPMIRTTLFPDNVKV